MKKEFYLYKKALIVAIAALSAPLAQAETLEASGSIAGYCTFSDTTSGTLTVSGTGISTASMPSTKVSQNDASGYELSVGTVSVTLPGNYTGTTSAKAVDFNVDSEGANPSIYNGTSDAGIAQSLPVVGTDTLQADFTATLSSAATAGAYSAAVEVSCVASGVI